MIGLTTVLTALGFFLFGYLSGSLPFSIWITRLLKGVDVRDSGSGHATTTNTIRQAGFGAGALVFLLDVSKGFIPAWLAWHFAPSSWITPITVAFVVIGHCWPVFAQFRGGMGLACAGGGLLMVSPLAFLIVAAVLIALVLALRHPARASVLVGILAAPALWLFGLRGIEFWIALAAGIVIACRFLIDWNRRYHELWLDRKNAE
ncbi:MAG TPA: glycerol-3-phosphate acyltransferase [Anaerolineales bacterium]|nr:glycerol-3-phosphate acyltransferase [Anaerolineales bacterium]